VANNFTDEAIAGNNVALNYFSKTFKLVVTDLENVTYRSTLILVFLSDINVDILRFPELPSQRNTILASRRWTEEEVTTLILVKL